MHWRASTWVFACWTVLSLLMLAQATTSTAQLCTESGLGSGCAAHVALAGAIAVFIWSIGAGLIVIARQRSAGRRHRR